MLGKMKFVAIAVCAAFFIIPVAVSAADTRAPDVTIFDAKTQTKTGSFLGAHPDFRGGLSVAVGDFGGDGTNEVAVAVGPGGPPLIKIFRADGSFVREFLAYDEEMDKGLYIATGDLNGDGKDEIVTGTRTGGGPHVRVFNGFGEIQFSSGFFAYEEDFRGGVRVAVGDVDGNGISEIITGPGDDHEPIVYVYSPTGIRFPIDFYPFASGNTGGVGVASGDIDQDGKDEIVTSIVGGGQGWIKSYNYDEGETIAGDFLAYPYDFRGGVNVAVGDVDGAGAEEIVAAVNRDGGPQLRFFQASGHELMPSVFGYEEGFRGGVLPAVGDLTGDKQEEVLAGPNNNPKLFGERMIEVDLSDQKLYAKQGDYVIREFDISSGLPGTPTPTGEFTIYRKLPVHLYAGEGYYLPGVKWNLNFLPAYYIHGTYWHNNFGNPMSHGCVNMRTEEVEWVYNDFADVGTKVLIHY